MEKRNFFFVSSNKLKKLNGNVFGSSNNSTPKAQTNNILRKSFTNSSNIENKQYGYSQMYYKNSEIKPMNYNNKPFPVMMPSQLYQNNGQFLNYNDQSLNYMFPYLNYPYTGNQVFIDNFNLDYNFEKIEENFNPFPYTYKLHNDIVEYSSDVTTNMNDLKKIKTFIIKFISDQIKTIIGKLLFNCLTYSSNR